MAYQLETELSHSCINAESQRHGGVRGVSWKRAVSQPPHAGLACPDDGKAAACGARAEVGVRLVQAHDTRLNMTDAGRLVYAAERSGAAGQSRGEICACRSEREPSGTIRISAAGRFVRPFPGSVAVFAFLAAYPKAKVELHLGRYAQSWREPDRPRFPHRDSSRLGRWIARKLGSTHSVLSRRPGLARSRASR